jgi:hypothetical protein
MRTKTLLIAAASALVAAVTSSQAQTTVYSQNIVGYVNLAIPSQAYAMYAPALDVDGTGTNGTILSVMGTNVDLGTQVLVWNPGNADYDFLTFTFKASKNPPFFWSLSGVGADNSYPLNVGQGFFVTDPNATQTYTNFTETGVVYLGGGSPSGAAVTNQFLPATAGTYGLIASQVPIGGYIDTNLDYQATVGDQIFVWNQPGQGFNFYTYTFKASKNPPYFWSLSGVGASDPNLSVGQGFFFVPENSGETWTETFTNN